MLFTNLQITHILQYTFEYLDGLFSYTFEYLDGLVSYTFEYLDGLVSYTFQYLDGLVSYTFEFCRLSALFFDLQSFLSVFKISRIKSSFFFCNRTSLILNVLEPSSSSV